MSGKREPFHWRTAIAFKTKDKIVIRGYDLNELIGRVDFASMAYLVLTGELPSENFRLMVNALLVSMAEHAFSPSSVSARFVASGGVPLNVAMAGGVMTMGERHASADIPAKVYLEGIERAKREGISIEECAEIIVSEHKRAKKILNGFHHPQHIKDPRVGRLFELSKEYRISGDYEKLARAMEKATKKVYGKFLYLNAPGAFAAIGCDMGLSPKQIKGLIVLSRTVSLAAHSIEEMEREKGWRASSKSKIVQPLDLNMQLPEYYDGPAERRLEK